MGLRGFKRSEKALFLGLRMYASVEAGGGVCRTGVASRWTACRLIFAGDPVMSARTKGLTEGLNTSRRR